MTITNNKLLNLIRSEKSIDEISKEMHLSYKEIYNRITSLENEGYTIKRKYNSDGNLFYCTKTNGSLKNKSFVLYNDKKVVKMMVMSDLHIGNIKADEEAINTVYNYAIKNNIHLITHCGDLIDGTYSKNEKLVEPENQVEHFLDIYPFDKSIINLYRLGDHDLSLGDCGISLKNALDIKRHDFANISKHLNDSSPAIISINNNDIKVSHKTVPRETSKTSNTKLHLIGHLHASCGIYNLNNDRTPRIYVPTLSRTSVSNETLIPRALELILYLDEEYKLSYIEKNQLLILNNKAINVDTSFINYTDSNLDIVKIKPKEKTLI